MAIFAGVDGCRDGWVVAYRDSRSGDVGALVVDSVANLFARMPNLTLVAIDIPIGLTDDERRTCDVEVRQRLGAIRGRSVFSAPIRPLLSATSHREACAIRGISLQTWGIIRKVVEVDRLLQSRRDLRERIVEVHPEMTFFHLNAGQAIVEPKKSAEGAAIRRRLIESHFGNVLDAARQACRGKSAKRDDIVDAFAALWTAERIAAGTTITYPAQPVIDSAGLPMRIVA